MRDTVKAYLAGVIDSDGTVGIKRSTYAMRRRGDAAQAVYSERVSVRQVEPQAVDLLAQSFGGSRYMTKPSTTKGRALHTWAVTDRQARDCLRSLLPYLRIKVGQARNALRLRSLKERSRRAMMKRGRGHAGAAHRPTAITEAMQLLYMEAKRLNRAGVRE